MNTQQELKEVLGLAFQLGVMHYKTKPKDDALSGYNPELLVKRKLDSKMQIEILKAYNHGYCKTHFDQPV